MKNDQGYHGDGVYSEDVGQMIKVWTPRESGNHIIYFESAVLWLFLVWLRTIGWLNDDTLERLKAMPTPEEREADDLGGLQDSTDEGDNNGL